MKKRNEDDRVTLLMRTSSFLLNLFDDSRTPPPPSGVSTSLLLARLTRPAQTRCQGRRSMHGAIKHRPNHGRLMVVGVALTVVVPAQVASTSVGEKKTMQKMPTKHGDKEDAAGGRMPLGEEYRMIQREDAAERLALMRRR